MEPTLTLRITLLLAPLAWLHAAEPSAKSRSHAKAAGGYPTSSSSTPTTTAGAIWGSRAWTRTSARRTWISWRSMGSGSRADTFPRRSACRRVAV